MFLFFLYINLSILIYISLCIVYIRVYIKLVFALPQAFWWFIFKDFEVLKWLLKNSTSFSNEYIYVYLKKKHLKTLVGVGSGTCSNLVSFTNTQYVCMSNGCNQISSCWNPVASSTATALISCPPTSSTSQTYACFVSEASIFIYEKRTNFFLMFFVLI